MLTKAWTYVMLAVIVLAAALIAYLNIRKSLKNKDCSSCGGCRGKCSK